MTARALVALVLLASLAACDSQTPEAPPLLPLDLGTAWVFESERTFGSDAYPGIDHPADTLRVVGDSTIDGVRWAELRAGRTLPDLSGYYADIDGDLWFTSSLDSDPVWLYDREATSYSIRVSDFDADVQAAGVSTRTYAFDYSRLRIGSGESAREFPVRPGGPGAIRSFEPGVGFARFDIAYFFYTAGGTDSLRTLFVDTFTRTARPPRRVGLWRQRLSPPAQPRGAVGGRRTIRWT